MDEDNNFGMQSIADMKAKGFKQMYVEQVRMIFTHDWIFDKVYEKIILSACFVNGLICLVKFLWRFF